MINRDHTVIFIMGTSGIGKSTIGKLLAEELSIPFFDGDDFHSKEHIQKMANGESLDDDDRFGWLTRLNGLAKNQLNTNSCIIACSALKEKYRELLSQGIEKIGFRERVRIEKKEFFYNRNVTVKLGKEVNGKFEYIQPKNIKRSIATNYYYSSLEIGYKKGGEYEEAMGLDEYNTKSTFTTVINIGDKLELISDYRADSYGMEFARRKPKENNPTTDTNYDRDIFLNDLKRGITDVFEQRVWQDDFDQQPTGTYDPESATNLRLSPFNILLHHGWVIASGLTKYTTDYVRYGSSIANSNLTTKLIGKPEYSENGNIQNNLLERARFVPEIIKFEFPVNFELMQKIQGSSVILGKTIPNVYGLIAFKNERGEIEKGYLENLKPNNKGVWELLKANK